MYIDLKLILTVLENLLGSSGAYELLVLWLFDFTTSLHQSRTENLQST